MKFIYIPIALCFMFACSNETEVTTEVADVLNAIDSTQVITEPENDPIISEPADEVSFDYFEDYATLTSREDIGAALGAENLKEDTTWYAEGTVMMSRTTYNNPENGQRIMYVWTEENPLILSHIEAHYAIWPEDDSDILTQKVTTREGLYTGMPLSEIVEWNGADFSFSGFGWDYEGGVFAEDGSKIQATPINFQLTLDYFHGDTDNSNLYGDIEFNSADEVVKGESVMLGTMSFYIGE